MDSMRHLSTSLPRTRRRENPSELLNDFKAAALSVTNLFKAAATAESKARNAGYQDALDDLLAMLDKEDLGLMDGEGWRVRQWATERLTDDGVVPQLSSDEEEDAPVDRSDEVRSSSQNGQRKPPTLPPSSSELVETTSPQRKSSSEPPQPPASIPSLDKFTFRSNHAYPLHTNSSGTSMDVEPISTSLAASPLPTTEMVRPVSRTARARHTNHNRRGNSSVPSITLSSTSAKRKMPYPDFFDISNSPFDNQDKKDGSGRGGKRGRFT